MLCGNCLGNGERETLMDSTGKKNGGVNVSRDHKMTIAFVLHCSLGARGETGETKNLTGVVKVLRCTDPYCKRTFVPVAPWSLPAARAK